MLKSWRRERGLSQRALARHAGVSYKTIQLIESGQDCRWSTLSKLAKAMRLPNPQTLVVNSPETTAAAVAVRLSQGEGDAWKEVFFDFVDDFRRNPSAEKIAQAPPPQASARALALVASTVECLCAERGILLPWWCSAAQPLGEPWFPSGMENLKASALVESPAAFRQRNIFVLANFLSRA